MDGSVKPLSTLDGSSANRTHRRGRDDAREHVFISHASPDAQTARILCAVSESAGIPCWIAPRDLVAGKHFAEQISKAIERSASVIVLLSMHTMRSKHVAREVYFAEETQIPVLPIRIDGSDLDGSLKYLLGLSHHLDIAEQGLLARTDEVLAAIHRSCGPREEPSEPPIASAEALRSACHQILEMEAEEEYFRLSVQSVKETSDASHLKPNSDSDENILRRLIQGLEETSFVFLVGEAGSGKSMSLREIARVYARNLLNQLGDERSMSHLSMTDARLPVLLDLTRMDFNKPDCVSILESQLFLSLSRLGLEPRFESQKRSNMRFLCASAGLLLLVDGLNQIVPEHRDSCVQALQEIRTAYRDVQVLVAARPRSFLAPAELRSVEIAPLNGQQALAFLNQRGMSAERAEALLDDFAHSGTSLARAASNPFFLTLACDQLNRNGDTPAHLADLLNEFVERRIADVASFGQEALLLRRCLHSVASSIQHPGGSLRYDALLDAVSKGLSEGKNDAPRILTLLERTGLIESVDDYTAFWHQNVHEFLIADAIAYHCTDGLPPEGRLTLAEGSTGERELQRLFKLFVTRGEPWDVVVRLFAERAEVRSKLGAVQALRVKTPRLAAIVFRSIAIRANPKVKELLDNFHVTASKCLLKAERAYGHRLRRALLWLAYLFGLLAIFTPPEEIDGTYTAVSFMLLFIYITIWDILILFLIVTVPLLLVLLSVRTLQRHSRDRNAEKQISVLQILGDEESVALHSSWYDQARRGDLRSTTLRGLLLASPPACEPFDEANACELLLEGKERLYQLSMLASRGTKACLESVFYAVRIGDRSVGFFMAALATLVRIQRRNPETRSSVADLFREVAEDDGTPGDIRSWAARILESWKLVTKSERQGFEKRAVVQAIQYLLTIIPFIAVTWTYIYLLDTFVISSILGGSTVGQTIYSNLSVLFVVFLYVGSWARNKVASIPRPIGYLALVPDLYGLQFLPLWRMERAVLGRWYGSIYHGRSAESLWALLRNKPERCELIAYESRDQGITSEPQVLANAGVAWLWRGDEERAVYWLNLAMENLNSKWRFRHEVERYLELLPRLKVVRGENAVRFAKVRETLREGFKLKSSSQASGWAKKTLKQEKRRSR